VGSAAGAVDLGGVTTTLRELLYGAARDAPYSDRPVNAGVLLARRFGARPMRDLIKLTCQTCKRDNYVTDKNKRTQTEKFEIKKFCRACRCHTAHKEGKISKG
jgi:large subunit ribosomal protein L33